MGAISRTNHPPERAGLTTNRRLLLGRNLNAG